jgi:hypothetical protein
MPQIASKFKTRATQEVSQRHNLGNMRMRVEVVEVVEVLRACLRRNIHAHEEEVGRTGGSKLSLLGHETMPDQAPPPFIVLPDRGPGCVAWTPCRRTVVTFEVERNGSLAVYLITGKPPRPEGTASVLLMQFIPCSSNESRVVP